MYTHPKDCRCSDCRDDAPERVNDTDKRQAYIGGRVVPYPPESTEGAESADIVSSFPFHRSGK